jgi:diadenylate cyclase
MAPSRDISSHIRTSFAPGTVLRDAVDMIDRQGTGALILIGTGPGVDAVSAGGFFLKNAELTAQRVAELAKMDGGIVVDGAGELIRRANVHFMPDATIATNETGTRFRTAEQLALATGCPVLSVSEEGRSLAVVFSSSGPYVLRDPAELLAEANQMLASTSRIRGRLEEARDRLTRLEVDDLVTVHDVVLVLQRAVLVHRFSAEVEDLLVELGGEAHLIELQIADLLDGVDDLTRLVYADYGRRRGASPKTMFARLESLATQDLSDGTHIAEALRFDELEAPARPRGIRTLAGVPRLPEAVKDALIDHFRDFQRLIHASVDELDEVEGVGTARAQQLRTYFDRLYQGGSIVP